MNIKLEDCNVGDKVMFVTSSGEVMVADIENMIQMHTGGILDTQIMFYFSNTKQRRQYLYSKLRIEKIISKIKDNDRLQDSSRLYYILC